MGLPSPPFPQPGPKGRSPHAPPLTPSTTSRVSVLERAPLLLSPPPPPEFSWLGSLPAVPSCGPLQPPTFVSQAGWALKTARALESSPGDSPLATSGTPTGPQRSLAQAWPLPHPRAASHLTEPQPKAVCRRPSLSSRQSSSLRTPFSSLPHSFSLIVSVLDHKLCEAGRPSGAPCFKVLSVCLSTAWTAVRFVYCLNCSPVAGSHLEVHWGPW